MKRRGEFREKAFRLAKEEGYDKVHFQGIYEGYEVYMADYNELRCEGLPQLIFANEQEVKWELTRDPFRIMDACRKG